jgi:hypothetical protein
VTQATRIWRLLTASSNYLGLIPHDLSYFHTHFSGVPMSDDWIAPPFKISNRSKKLPDFVSWMLCAPVLSERAAIALRPLLSDHVQFLPFGVIKTKTYYALNALRVQKGLLDYKRSTVLRSSADPMTIIMIERAFFNPEAALRLPPIFKLAEGTGDIFVTDEFAHVAVEQKLTGLALADPEVDTLPLILRRLPLNACPGIAE